MNPKPPPSTAAPLNRTYRLAWALFASGWACLAALIALVVIDAVVEGYSVPDKAWDTLGTVAAWLLGAGGTGVFSQGARHIKPTLPPPPEKPEVPPPLAV